MSFNLRKYKNERNYAIIILIRFNLVQSKLLKLLKILEYLNDTRFNEKFV